MTTRGAFVGPLGGLVEIAHYRGSIATKTDQTVTFKRTLGGGVRGFASPDRGLREWSVNAGRLSPAQYGPFEALLSSGPGPWAFVDPLAQMTNVITPRGSLFASGVTGGTYTVGGAFTAADGTRYPSSLVATAGTVYFATGTPVLPGVTVTGSVYASAGARVHLHILDGAGAILSNVSATAATQGARLVVSAVPPAGAVSARLVVPAAVYPGTVAGPAIVWSKRVADWSPGRGAASTVVHSLSDEVVVASATQQRKSLSFTVTEVGNGA